MKPQSIYLFYNGVPLSDLIWIRHQISNEESLTLKGDVLMCQLSLKVPH